MTRSEITYTAPACRILTVLHIAGEDGRTACGLECVPADLWQPVERRPGDVVHPACLRPQEAAEEQGALL